MVRQLLWLLRGASLVVSLASANLQGADSASDRLPETELLTWDGDLAARMLDGAHVFADRQLAESIGKRAAHWRRDFSSVDAYRQSMTANRMRLAHILGMRDARAEPRPPQIVASPGIDPLLAKGRNYSIYEIRWEAVGTIVGEGLLLVPDGAPRARIVVIPDADQTPEMLCGLDASSAPSSWIAAQLAEAGCLAVVPALVSRSREPIDWHGMKYGFTHREFLYRSAYELGRHLIGYELQKALALVDWFEAEERDSGGGRPAPIGMWGYGEGGMLALFAAALDDRIDAACVSGYFNDRNQMWRQPIERNVFGLLEQFGDAELATMAAPRRLTIEASKHPAFELPPGTGGAPAKLETPALAAVRAEVNRARLQISDASFDAKWLELVGDGHSAFGSEAAWKSFTTGLGEEQLGDVAKIQSASSPQALRSLPDAAARVERMARNIDRHTQEVLRESAYTRMAFMKDLQTTSIDAYNASIEHYRDTFRNDVVGRFAEPLLPAHPRSRKLSETDRVVSYEVVLDVFPDVFAYGILSVPRDIKPGEKRPAVVCQHGLEGRPQSVIGEIDFHYYKAFATALAERGFVTFAPQNIYIFEDRFRSLQRKLYPLKKTLFSLMVPQHQQIVDWLQTQPFVDPERVAFYGLSYGGKSAMRIPPLVTDYCLSICSADFNEWVDKNASTRNPRSYVWSGEYEIFEWDLGSTFNYAEMAALIAPRPFMVERGHSDGVADDWTVAWEFAKVRELFENRLGIGDRCEIEWFVGPHSINGKGTYRFLHRHLMWPEPRE